MESVEAFQEGSRSMGIILVLIGLTAFAIVFERVGYFSGYDKGFEDAVEAFHEEIENISRRIDNNEEIQSQNRIL